MNPSDWDDLLWLYETGQFEIYFSNNRSYVGPIKSAQFNRETKRIDIWLEWRARPSNGVYVLDKNYSRFELSVVGCTARGIDNGATVLEWKDNPFVVTFYPESAPKIQSADVHGVAV